jgi:exopolysaccharide production protein ExoZ
MTAASAPASPDRVAQPGAEARPEFLGSIQALRAFAAMAVMLYHLGVFPLGATGVDLFFVISGLIMGRVGLTERPGQFLRRRLARIVPLYWLATAMTCAALVVKNGWSAGFTLRDLILSLLFVPHVSSSHDNYPIVMPGWTLELEVFFYLLFGLCLMLRRTVPAIVTVLAALVALGAMLAPHGPVLRAYTSPLLLEFAAGIILSRVHFRLREWAGWGLLAAGVMVFGVAGLAGGPDSGGFLGDIVLGGASCMLVGGALAIEARGAWPRMPAMLALGDASYAFYLFHLLVLAVLHRVVVAPALAVPVAIVCCCAAALAIHRWIEKPMLRTLR